ncbi:MAG: hypothetical protein ACF8XB_19855 [Planctomycetota bacterium JB042]
MTDDATLDRDLEQLRRALPEPLREDWVVVPKSLLIQVFLVGLLIGAAFALLAVRAIYGIEELTWAVPVALVSMMLAARFVPWWRGDKAEQQLRKARSEER